MSIEIITLLMVGSLLFLVVIGMPLAFALGFVAVSFAYIFFGFNAIQLIASRIYGFVNVYVLLSVPMFLLMAAIMDRSGVARDLYDAISVWGGGLPGGVAVMTLIAAVFMAATTGIIGGEIILLGLVALPQMLRLGYHKNLAIGTICAGGSLGTMIPPSIVLIFYGLTANVAIGNLFVAVIMPGLLLASFYLVYILVRCALDPNLGPPLPAAERDIPLRQKVNLLKGLVLPMGIAFGVLASIYAGIAAVAEAAAVGVAGTIIAAWLRGALGWEMLQDCVRQTMSTCGLLLWLTFGATALIGVYNLLGGIRFIQDAMTRLAVFTTDDRPDHDGCLDRARALHGLGRHSAADHADLRSDYRKPRLRRRVVRHSFLHEYADLLSFSPFRPGSVLPERRGAAGDQPAGHLPRTLAIHADADRGDAPGADLPGDRALAPPAPGRSGRLIWALPVTPSYYYHRSGRRKMRNDNALISVTSAAALTLAVSTMVTAPVSAEQVWKVQTSMSAGESFYTNIEEHWLPKLEAMTGGELKIELTPVGSVVPYNETMDAISQGILQGDITATVYFSGRSKAFAILGDLIAGYETPDQIGMFCYHGGGRDLIQEAYDTYAGDVQVVGCGSIARESFTSKVPIRTLEDLERREDAFA